MSERSDPGDSVITADEAAQWILRSEEVQAVRQTPEPARSNNRLLHDVEEMDAPLGPLLVLWAADNLRLESRYQAALDLYEATEERARDEDTWSFGAVTSKDLLLNSMAGRATALEALDAPSEAIALRRKIAAEPRPLPGPVPIDAGGGEAHALTMVIRAPWPEGLAFRAGGLGGFIIQAAALLVMALGRQRGMRAAGAALAALAARRCGFGLPGFYYDQGPTHRRTHAFAVDFTRYQRGIPFLNASGGTPVLATAPGQVFWVVDHVPRSDHRTANRVEIRHGRWTHRPGKAAPSGTGFEWEPYLSRYLHLGGPSRIPVSLGMFARTGAVLGFMSNTGRAVVDHLHFSIHDLRFGGRSIPPNPMDGQALLDDDGGKTIVSSNSPFPPP